ncbi:MAG: GYD domain-containing protein [Halobacteriota archaeon]
MSVFSYGLSSGLFATFRRKGGDYNHACLHYAYTWTQAGTEQIKDDPQRIERLRNIFKSVGGEIKALYFTFGRYDKVVIVEAPSDEAMGKAVLMLGGFGTVHVETL